MCLLIDTNIAVLFFKSKDFEAARTAILEGRCCVYYGGKLRRELEKINEIRGILLALDSAGRAKALPDGPIDLRENELRNANACESDDEHVIALAQISGSRLLCSNDDALGRDFRNKELLNSPRGSIYKRPTHKHLLKKHCRSC